LQQIRLAGLWIKLFWLCNLAQKKAVWQNDKVLPFSAVFLFRDISSISYPSNKSPFERQVLNSGGCSAQLP